MLLIKIWSFWNIQYINTFLLKYSFRPFVFRFVMFILVSEQVNSVTFNMFSFFFSSVSFGPDCCKYISY